MREDWCFISSSKKKIYYKLKLFSIFDMNTKRTLNVHKALEYLEDLEVSSSDEPDFENEFASTGRLGGD